MFKVLLSLLSLGVILLCRSQPNLCDNASYLQGLFFAAQNHQCIFVRISATDGNTHSTSYSEGCIQTSFPSLFKVFP